MGNSNSVINQDLKTTIENAIKEKEKVIFFQSDYKIENDLEKLQEYYENEHGIELFWKHYNVKEKPNYSFLYFSTQSLDGRYRYVSEYKIRILYPDSIVSSSSEQYMMDVDLDEG